MSVGGASLTTETHVGDIPKPRFGHSTTYIGNDTVVLFGGAVGDTGHYQITNDFYQLDLRTMMWSQVVAQFAPPARAAHGAAKVDSMQLVIYGGAAGGGTLSSEDLYLLDIKSEPNQLKWLTVPIAGTTPGRRYGHTIVYNKPHLIVFGGNDGHQSLKDIWYMDVQRCPFQWNEVVLPANSKGPDERVYHSAEICKEGPATGMMVIFGGRTTDNASLRDVWGLRQHRDGQWDWVAAPVKKGDLPDPRFQHTVVFIGPKMFVVGGRESDVGKPLKTAVYDTEQCEWKFLLGMGRFRHASWVMGTSVYTFGGFDHQTQSHPTGDLQKLELGSFIDTANRRKPKLLDTEPVPPNKAVSPSRLGEPMGAYATPMRVKLAGHVNVTHYSPQGNNEFANLVHKVSLDRLNAENTRIRGHQTPLDSRMALQTVHGGSRDEFADRFLINLLRPNISVAQMHRDYNSEYRFCVAASEISLLIDRCMPLFRQEDTLLTLRAPIKVYGDIHGQYYDLMRLFGTYRAPVPEDWLEDFRAELPSDMPNIEGDIDSNDYLFLGDFVDRGSNSLEVICLLLALKLKFPKQVHLIRGNHEDTEINRNYGFSEECRRRLGEQPERPGSVYHRMNELFELLPLGATIENKILCVHGGIGKAVRRLDDIRKIQRPLKVTQTPSTPMEQHVTDLLWSDPTENDSVLGTQANDMRDPQRSGYIVKFGPDVVMNFLQQNQLECIIRAHECVQDGFERFCQGRLITLFSATDYCNTHKNAGALLFIKRDLTMVPKIIYPTPAGVPWIKPLDSRPPTPPRMPGRVRTDFDDYN